MPKSDRVWNLRLNLDEFNSLIASVFTDGDRALLLQGFSLGCNGGPLPDGVPPAFMRGWMFGNSSRDEAEEFKARQSAKGKASAESRREKSGTAQPIKPDSNHGSELDRTGVQTAPEAILNPQSYNNNLQTTNDNPPPKAPPGGRRTAKTALVAPDTYDGLTTTRASATPVVAAKEEPASKIVQAAWADLLDEGYKAVRFRAWSPDMTRQARALAKIYKDYDFDDLFRRALGVMVNDPWLKEHPHHFNAHRIMRPEIFAMYADKCEIPEETPPDLPIERLQ